MKNPYEKSPDNRGQNNFITIPVYSEEKDEDGEYEIIGYKKEYI